MASSKHFPPNKQNPKKVIKSHCASIPFKWFKKVINKSGHTDVNAILILFCIVKSYSDHGYKGEVKLSYESFAEFLGLEVTLIKRAMQRLVKLNLISIEIRDDDDFIYVVRDRLHITVKWDNILEIS